MKINYKYISVLFLILSVAIANGQINYRANQFNQQEKTEESSAKEQNQVQKPETTPNHPLEFPSMTVEGKEQLKVQSGIKQYPIKVQSLSPAQIDSISPVHKQQALLIPAKSLISNIITRDFKNNYLNVYAGMFTTLNADAGLTHIVNDFTLALDAHTFYTGGHIKNSEELDAGFKFDLSYLAPRKYWIFGGSKVLANLDLNVNNYNMYALDSAFGRNSFDLNLGVKSDGEFKGYMFSTGAQYDIFNISHNNDLAENNNIIGFLSLKKALDSTIQLKASGNVRFGTSFGNSNNFLNFTAGAKIKLNSFIFDLIAGIQSTGSTDKIQRANLVIGGNLEYLLSKMFTLNAGVNMNFIDNDFRSNWMFNRFIEHKSKLDFPYERSLKVALNFHPNEELMFSGGIKLITFDRFRYFLINENRIYNLEYSDASGINLFLKASVLLSKNSNISAEIDYQNLHFINSENNSSKIPNLAPINIMMSYNRKWGEKFGTNLEVDYIGKRFSDIENKNEVKSFVNLAVKLSYKLFENLSVYIKGDNLLNQNRYYWDKYRDRDLFLSLGALWQF